MNENCIFCSLPREKIALENNLCLSFYDKYPVNLGHMLIIPKRHFASILEASPEEVMAIHELLIETQAYLNKEFHPDGFNLGINQGEVAGQTIFHLHLHIIPRYLGDVKNPRGGVRNFKENMVKY